MSMISIIITNKSQEVDIRKTQLIKAKIQMKILNTLIFRGKYQEYYARDMNCMMKLEKEHMEEFTMQLTWSLLIEWLLN